MFGARFFGRHYWGLRFFGAGGEPVPLTFPTAPGQIVTVDQLSASVSVDASSSQIAVDALSSIIVADARNAVLIGG